MLEITVREAEVFFQTVTSLNRTDALTIDQFVDACMKMKGPASGIDMQAISFQMTNASTPIPTVTSSSSPSQSSSPTSTPTRLPPPGLNCDAASDRAEIMSIFISQVTDV